MTGMWRSYGTTDVEVWEDRYPVLFAFRRRRRGVGVGRYRSGAAFETRWRPHGVEVLDGMTWGTRRWQPMSGAAGGLPGLTTSFTIIDSGGSPWPVPMQSSRVTLRSNQWMEVRAATGGDWGDPLDRDPITVARDLDEGRISADDLNAYGVVLDDNGNPDLAATATRRLHERRRRLSRALPQHRPVTQRPSTASSDDAPLYPGVIQRKNLAVAERTGAVLAEAPHHWTDGCPFVEELLWPGDAPAVRVRMYLDPSSGDSLYVDVVPDGHDRSFSTEPTRWTGARPV